MKRYHSRARWPALAALLICAADAAYAQVADTRVHDPVMIKQGDSYYLFATGRGIAVWSSQDMRSWEREPPVFEATPEWTDRVVPGFRNHIWAPDIYHHDGTYYLYYSVSAFGRNTSAIGVATNTTLDADDPAFEWVDHGIVVQSVPGRDMWNAIDPNRRPGPVQARHRADSMGRGRLAVRTAGPRIGSLADGAARWREFSRKGAKCAKETPRETPIQKYCDVCVAWEIMRKPGSHEVPTSLPGFLASLGPAQK